MTSNVKKYKNREYYQSNRELIKNRARERYRMTKKGPGDPVEPTESEILLGETLTLVRELAAPIVQEVKQQSQSLEPKGINFAFDPALGALHTFACQYEYRDLKITEFQWCPEKIAAEMESRPELETRHIEPAIAEDSAEEIQQILSVPSVAEKIEIGFAKPEQAGWSVYARRLVRSPATLFQVLFISGLTSILTVMQIGFYQVHDVYPELAVPLAVACELSLLYLVSLRCEGLRNFLRIGIYGLLFGYIVSSLSFDVFFQSRNRLKETHGSSRGSSESEEMLKEELRKAQIALEISTKGRSWKNMALFGEQVASIQKRIEQRPIGKEFGVTDSEAAVVGARLLVLLRGILMAVNSLAVCGMRRAL